MAFQVAVVCLMAAHASSMYTNYAPYPQQNFYQPQPPTYPTAPPAPPEPSTTSKPIPYMFHYNVKDKHGNTQSRKESSDASGLVTGSYTITLVSGLSRDVSYTAGGKKGFNVVVKSNEPGFSDAKDPANADFIALPKVAPKPPITKPTKPVRQPTVSYPVYRTDRRYPYPAPWMPRLSI